MDELYAQYPTVITQMPDPFTSHQFILALAQQNQREYIGALHTNRDSDAPFRAVHARLSQALYDFPSLVNFLGEVDSVNIFGMTGRCAQWQKL